MQRPRKTILAGLAGVLALALVTGVIGPAAAQEKRVTNPTAGQDKAEGKKPNIVVIMTDDVGWGDLGCYGGGENRGAPTPNLDRMAAEGMRFTQHYCGNAVCAPSRCVLMTGKHPGHAFIRDNREAKPEGQFPDFS